MSIKEQLKQPGQSKPITGHDSMDIMRFAEDTRHMIIYDVLILDCPSGGNGERVRVFLSDEGYKQAQESEGRGEMRIVRRAYVRKGDIIYYAPERDHEEH